MPPIAGKGGLGLRPVERQEARGPSIGDAKPVQIVEHPRKRNGRKAQNGHGAQMAAADRRRKTAGQRLIAKECVQIGRNPGNSDGMPLRRDTAVQIGQRVLVVERGNFRQNRREQIDGPVGLLNEALEMLLVAARPRGALRRLTVA